MNPHFNTERETKAVAHTEYMYSQYGEEIIQSIINSYT